MSQNLHAVLDIIVIPLLHCGFTRISLARHQLQVRRVMKEGHDLLQCSPVYHPAIAVHNLTNFLPIDKLFENDLWPEAKLRSQREHDIAVGKPEKLSWARYTAGKRARELGLESEWRDWIEKKLGPDAPEKE